MPVYCQDIVSISQPILLLYCQYISAYTVGILQDIVSIFDTADILSGTTTSVIVSMLA